MKLYSKFLIVCLVSSQAALAGWDGQVYGDDEKGREGKVRLIYKSGSGKSLEEVLKNFIERGEILKLDTVRLEILKDPKLNQQLVKALEKQAGKETSTLGENIGWGSFHHPDVRHFSGHLQPAVLSLPEVDQLPAALARHGLTPGHCGCEKFSFERKDGKIRATGFGIYLHVKPVDFGMPVRRDGISGYLSLGQIFREDDQWVGVFSLSSDEEKDSRFYGRWSTEHELYVIDQYQMGWTHGVKWSASDQPGFADSARTFRLKKGTSHSVRIELGSESHPRTSIRVYGPGISLDSRPFILGEQSYSFREKKSLEGGNDKGEKR